MKILIFPLALTLLAGMSYGGYANYKRMWAEDKAIDSWVAKMKDDDIASSEILLDYCKIQPIPFLRKGIAKYEAAHGPSLEQAKNKKRLELISNPFVGLVKNMCPLFQQQMDDLQRKIDAS